MKKLILVLLLSLVAIICVVESFDFQEAELETEEKLRGLYQRWGRHHMVSRDVDDKHRRYQVFKANAHYINSSNKKDRPFKLGLNKFADMTSHEFRSIYTGCFLKRHRTSSPGDGTFMYQNVHNVADSVDWRANGAVTDVRDQGEECSGCWAFSTVAAVEGITFIKTKSLVALSEQELIDCDTGNSGCNGGHMNKAMEYVKNNGLTTEDSYPYTAATGQCDGEKAKTTAATIDDHADVPEDDEGALLKAVANQPVTVAIEASGDDFRFYNGGVFTGDCGNNINHGVTAVGYGTAPDGTDYWVIKNSWGTGWGENGYVRMERGEDLCGIAIEASFPIKK